MKRILKTVFPFAVTGLVTVCGAVMLFCNVGNLVTYYRAKSWASTMGTITSSSVAYDSSWKGISRYKAEISYQYIIDNVEFENDGVYPGFPPPGSSDYTAALSLSSNYPVGSATSVFYNPRNPSCSVLRQREASVLELVIGPLFSIPFLVMGVVPLWGLCRKAMSGNAG